jgi:hypothetical protein
LRFVVLFILVTYLVTYLFTYVLALVRLLARSLNQASNQATTHPPVNQSMNQSINQSINRTLIYSLALSLTHYAFRRTHVNHQTAWRHSSNRWRFIYLINEKRKQHIWKVKYTCSFLSQYTSLIVECVNKKKWENIFMNNKCNWDEIDILLAWFNGRAKGLFLAEFLVH